MKLSNVTVLLLAGVAVGAIAALLLAPDEGIKTRKKLLKKANKLKREFKDKASEYKGKVSDFKDNMEGAAGDVKKRFS